ncbi:MAG: monovalent cation/H+ antiporter complex subunit F [Candidatus Omnitrophica bacterium]|nr:monovalent cation/H+ antiporter complex subunit F [Candidatus Omnitrophota bacterium]
MAKYIRWFAGILFLSVAIFLIFSYLKDTITIKLTLLLVICFTLSLVRILRGPTPADRAVATDILGIFIIGVCAIMAIYTERDWYIDIAIAWALQSFIGILALAKFLEGKRFDD